MKLKYYKPKGHNLIIEYYEEKERKQGLLYLPTQTNDNAIPMGRVLALGDSCDGIEIDDIVALDSTHGIKEIAFEDHIGICYSINQHLVIGVFKNDSV
jgi:co-chaperonin GroES (HSP10)